MIHVYPTLYHGPRGTAKDAGWKFEAFPMTRRGPEFSLENAVRSRSFTPSARDVGGLIGLLETGDESLVKAIQNSLIRIGALAAPIIASHLPAARRPVRGHLVKVIGRIGQRTQDPKIAQMLLSLLYDDDLKTRRNAILALGQFPIPAVERALLEKWRREDRIDHRRSIAAALGRVGGGAALAALTGYETEDPELKRILTQARLMISRNLTRGEESTIADAATPRSPVRLIAHCRAGLERILSEEFDASWNPKVLGPGRVDVTLRGALKTVFRARTMETFGIALGFSKGRGVESVVKALTGEEALKIFKTWTRGSIRYRLEWTGAGHRRADVWNCVKSVTDHRPELINDPSGSTWEAVIRESKEGVDLELRPKKLADPRFAYRLNYVYAASHPTLAAALARVAGVRPDDVVWDPFVGSGTELAERAIAGPYRQLRGTDTDPRAIEIAKQNLKAAGIGNAVLGVADAPTAIVPGVTLILTNPPMGRRSRPGDVGPMLSRFIEHAADQLVPGGRLVWISPNPKESADIAKRSGLRLNYKQDIDMGGFRGQIQRYDKR